MSEDLKLIKKRILEEDRISELLDKIGCEHIKSEQGGRLITAQLPPKFDSRNKRSVQVRSNDKLSSYVRNRGFKGDVFGLVSLLVNDQSIDNVQNDLYNAKKWIIDQLGYYDLGRVKSSSNVNSWLKDIKKVRKHIATVDEHNKNNPIDESIKNRYIMNPYYGWIEEGIHYGTQEEFETGFDLWTDRVVNMIRDKDGNLIGVKGRYIGDDKDTLEQRKYLYLEPINKGIELFNFHKALEYIKKHKMIVIFEGYKSVMKSWQMGLRCCVSIEGDEITDVQVAMIKELGVDIDIVIAFDKDKMYFEDDDANEYDYPYEIYQQGKKFTNRKVYALIDNDDLLKGKDSPVDRGLKVYKKLLKKKMRLKVESIYH